MEHTLLSPKNDFVFKNLFGVEENKDILIDFLNALFKGEPTIRDLTFKNTDLQKVSEEDKYGILDILAMTETGMVVNVEIQVKNEKNIENRMLYYGSKLIFEQLSEGQPYSKIKRVITVAILDYNFFPEDSYHTRGRIKTDDNRHICKNLELHFVELKKIGTHIDSNDQFSMWAAFMNNPLDPELSLLSQQVPTLNKAQKDLERMSNNDELRVLYHARQKVLHDMASQLEQGREEGIELGREEGIELGREEGIELGIHQGKIEVAKKLLAVMDNEAIAELTGLTSEQVQQLR